VIVTPPVTRVTIGERARIGCHVTGRRVVCGEICGYTEICEVEISCGVFCHIERIIEEPGVPAAHIVSVPAP
jgi:hypothetical protein